MNLSPGTATARQPRRWTSGAERPHRRVRLETDLEHALRQNDNLAFGFVFDKEANTLTDRRGADADVRESQRQLADQSRSSPRRRRLFK